MERAKRFDTRALEEIFDKYSPGIYRYAYRLLGNTELASECMSETFSRFLNALKQGSGPEYYLQAYLYRIAHNWITDFYRRNTPIMVPLEQDLNDSQTEGPHEVVAAKLEIQQLRYALTLLTPEQRQVIVLKYLENSDNETIAQAMNKPIGAIKALQHRGIESLRRILVRFEDKLV